MNKVAGLYTQIQQLKKRLKDLNTAEADPAEISGVADALEKLEVRLQKQKEQKKQRQEDKQKAQEEAKRKEVEELAAVPKPTQEKPVQETPVQETPTPTENQTDAPVETTPTPTPTSTPQTEVTVEAPQTETTEVPMAASTEKESDVNIFALDTIVEPSKGTPGSWGRVMRHDSPDEDVFVIWEGGKLKDDHVAGGYSPKDLRLKAASEEEKKESVEPEVLKKEKEERKKREEEYQKKRKEMGLSGKKLSKKDTTSSLTALENQDVKPGTKFVFVRSVMAKDGIILPAGTEATLSKVIGDHFYIKTADDAFVINRFDTPKLIIRAGLENKELVQKYLSAPESTSDQEIKDMEIQLWELMYPVEKLRRQRWQNLQQKYHSSQQTEQTPSHAGDPSEDPAAGYGGDRPGQWVEPKSAKTPEQMTNEELEQYVQMLEKDIAESPVGRFSPYRTQMIEKYKPYEKELIRRKKSSLKVAQKEWFAKKNNLGYLISDEAGTDVCLIKSEANLSKQQLEEIVYNELLKREMLTFSFKKPVGFLKQGHKIDILETDYKLNKFKFVSQENKTAGWAPLDALKIEVKSFQNGVKKKGKIVRRKDGWYVQSEQGKNLGGPYQSREKAQNRLQQVEMFKHMKARQLSKNGPITIQRSVINNLVKNCPDCWKKFTRVAKEGKLRFKVAEDVETTPEEQIQRVRERLETIKTRFETQSKQATLRKKALHDEEWEDLIALLENRYGTAISVQLDDYRGGEPLENQNPNALRYIVEFLEDRLDRIPDEEFRLDVEDHINDIRNYLSSEAEASQKKAEDHPIEEPAVADVIRDLEMNVDKLENMYRDNPEAIQGLEEIEDKINEVEMQIGVDLPEMAHEREEGHEDVVEKETAYKKPKPTTPAPQGFRYAYDPQTQDWVLVVAD